MEIEFIETEQDWKNETTRYWHTVDGVEFALADQNGDLTLIDEDGYPYEGNYEAEKIKAALVERVDYT